MGEEENDDFAVVFGLGNQQDFRVERGKGKWCLKQYSGLEISRISEFLRETATKFWTEERHEAFNSLQEPTFFSNKICSLKAQKVLATFCYKKYYRWLTVDPLGDVAFLKASRTSDMHSLGG